jgi:hypothetical protein
LFKKVAAYAVLSKWKNVHVIVSALFNIIHQAITSIIDQDIDTGKSLDGLRHSLAALLLVGHVQWQGQEEIGIMAPHRQVQAAEFPYELPLR